MASLLCLSLPVSGLIHLGHVAGQMTDHGVATQACQALATLAKESASEDVQRAAHGAREQCNEALESCPSPTPANRSSTYCGLRRPSSCKN
jgi:hypothetical protein